MTIFICPQLASIRKIWKETCKTSHCLQYTPPPPDVATSCTCAYLRCPCSFNAICAGYRPNAPAGTLPRSPRSLQLAADFAYCTHITSVFCTVFFFTPLPSIKEFATGLVFRSCRELYRIKEATEAMQQYDFVAIWPAAIRFCLDLFVGIYSKGPLCNICLHLYFLYY